MAYQRFVAAVLLVAAATAAGHGQSSPVNRPWPPGVQKVSDESPVLAPQEALNTFFMPPGYRLELVASEPLIQDPTVIDWDLEGRLWATEMTGFVRDLDTDEPFLEPIGRVVVLEDTNQDGRMDKRTVFADRLILPRALKVLDDGVLVGEPGTLWWMRDTNGDLQVDDREVVTTSFGRLRGSVEGNANGVFWALDNWMHTASAEVVLRRKNGTFEVRRVPSRGEWGVSQDDGGRIYRNTNESALHVDFVPTPYYARNPLLQRTRGSYEALRDPDNAVNIVWPVRPNPGTNRAYQAGIDRPDGTLLRFTSVCAPWIYRGDRLPAELYGSAFVAEPAANLVGRIVLDDDGTTLRARKAYEQGEFLASTDERFRPVYITDAPDGTLYITDFYRGIIQDRSSTTIYLRDHIIKRRLDRPTGLGRIYRVVHDTTTRDGMRPFAKASPSDLVAALSHPNGWRRDTAQRLIVERAWKWTPQVTSAVSQSLAALARSAPDWRTRVHALWTLDGIDRIEPGLVRTALDDRARDVRVAAIRIAERWLAEPSHALHDAVIAKIDDPDWSVRQQLAASLGALPAGVREGAVARLLERHAGDPVVLDAALSGLRGAELATLDRLLVPGLAETPQRADTLTMLASLVIRGGQDAAVQRVFARMADAGLAAWQRSALVGGAEVALLGRSLPAPPARRGGGAAARGAAAATPLPCPTCPGGRAGPGGAYAFREPAPNTGQRGGRGGRGGGRGGGPSVAVSREPAALTALAAGTTDLAKRAGAVLARVVWPGKPGAPAPVAPLSPAETARFEAGREIYRNICQQCHQPDGRGQERLAPSLVGSDFLLAAPVIPIRVLLNGKEGEVGLMPPLGATLSDSEIAAVLTYVRREWGQPGSPVDPSAVVSVRMAESGRQRPWTNRELQAFLEASSPGQED
jgi:mono/diheme cytochrome c family protein/glucose/arabinose dehydrogenase